MPSGTRQCQSCKTPFEIEAPDIDFYKRIGVPPPTFCPDCRAQRRMTWRNERAFYKGTCPVTKKNFLTAFSPESRMTVYDRDYWWSDDWNQLASGRDYDFSKPFFEQYKELLHAAPLPNLANTNAVRSEYGNHNLDTKDCYLVYASLGAENSAYSNGLVAVKDSFDIYKMLKSEQCYEVVLGDHLNRTFFSYDVGPVINSWFLKSCVEVTDSLGCVNLKSKSNYIFNRPLSKDEFRKEFAAYDLGSHRNLTAFRERFAAFTKTFPHRYAAFIRCMNVTGDMVLDAKNCQFIFDGYGGSEDCKFVTHTANAKLSYDGYGVGANAELLYEGVDTGSNGYSNRFSVFTHTCHDTDYTYCCHSSSNLFGCVGLRSKEYCILNRQYSKEEFHALRAKIIAQMDEAPYADRKGRAYGYGEFFPTEISPFAYNETIAQEYFPLDEKETEAKGYSWKAPEERHYAVALQAADIPDHIRDIGDDILEKIIGCEHEGKCNEQCTTAFKIIRSELEFHRQFNLPLPRLCPNCRHYARLRQRNPFRLWHRACQCGGALSENKVYANAVAHSHGEDHCPNKFETSYAPGREEIVYCEACYQNEVA